MNTFFSRISILCCALTLLACSGSGLTGPASLGGDSSGVALSADGPSSSGENPGVAQASGEGTLGSQSSNVDIMPRFYRNFTLRFEGESPNQGWVGFSFFLPTDPGKLPRAQVLNLMNNYQESSCPNCVGRWVRVVHCGNYSDEDIDNLIPEEEQGSPVADNKILWFLFNIPRLQGNGPITTCNGAVYQDFPVKAGGEVEWDGLKLHRNDIVVFYLLDANPSVDVGPLSSGTFSQISKEKIAATAAQGMLRYVRPLPFPPLQLNPQTLQIFKHL